MALYVPGPAIDEPIAMVTPNGNGTYSRKYFHTNHQGSVIAMSDDSGARVEGPFIYGPDGSCFQGTTPCAQLTNSVPYKFTSRRLDPETELYCDRARMYWATGGRFLQTDPVGYTADLNLYTYVGNDPVGRTDPTGMVFGIDDAAEAGVIAACAGPQALACGAIILGGVAIVGAGYACYEYCGLIFRNDEDRKAAQGPRRPSRAQAERARQRSRDAEGKEHCYLCGRETTREPGHDNSPEIEHKDPYSRGGKTEDPNLENSCRSCNRSKGSQTEEEFRNKQQQQQGRSPGLSFTSNSDANSQAEPHLCTGSLIGTTGSCQ